MPNCPDYNTTPDKSKAQLQHELKMVSGALTIARQHYRFEYAQHLRTIQKMSDIRIENAKLRRRIRELETKGV